VANSSNFNDESLANFCTAGKNRLYSQQSRLHLYSTKSNGIPNKDETDNDPKHDTHAETQPTVWEQLKSVPNIITLTRLASTPLLCYWIVNDEPNLAIVGCLLAGISDVLDGYIAKNHGGSTVLGTYLDPFADKFFINSLAVSLWYSEILPGPLVFLWASKDFILLGGMGWYLYREQRTINIFSNSIHTKPLTVTPSTLGKANTGLQFATLAIGILAPVVPPEFLQPVVLQSLCWVTGASSIITTLSYAAGGQGFKYTSKKTPSDKENGGVAADAGTNNDNNMNTKT
jgi:cardiolipin synthase